MSSDRSWMQRRFDERNNITDEYKEGVKEFIDFVIKKKETHGHVRVQARPSSSNTGHRDDDMYDAQEMLRDFGEAHGHFEEEETNVAAHKFYEMIDNVSEPLYPNNANITTLEFINVRS
ncbi:hypothetical protein POM88_011985 [Heracleum sosnowskyi]|uniref:Uncharacterized protein n=1 Tax=Heracleum sosnowskyi TaxID=360622 RepID=A0AAD8N1B1_9APIA|nr:hypothetical protein POM88_011985 [Heracleum sosnowskyi]